MGAKCNSHDLAYYDMSVEELVEWDTIISLSSSGEENIFTILDNLIDNSEGSILRKLISKRNELKKYLKN